MCDGGGIPAEGKEASVPSENSVRPASDAIPKGEAKSLSRSRPCLSLANESRRCTRVQASTVRTLISKPRGEAARSLVDYGFSGSPSFVAVMQPTDCSMDILDYDCLGVFIKFFNGAMRSLEAVLANLPLPFSGVLKSTRNTINPDTHCVSVL